MLHIIQILVTKLDGEIVLENSLAYKYYRLYSSKGGYKYGKSGWEGIKKLQLYGY